MPVPLDLMLTGVQIIAAPWREDIALLMHVNVPERSSRRRWEDFRMPVDLPEAVSEVSEQFARYEKALVMDTVAVLDKLFCRDAADQPLGQAT